MKFKIYHFSLVVCPTLSEEFRLVSDGFVMAVSFFFENCGIVLVLGSCSIVPLIFSMKFNETAALDDIVI